MEIAYQQAYIDLFQEFVILSNVERHSVAVTSFAIYLAQEVEKRKKIKINYEIVFATSLFHDLAKISQVKILEPEKYGFDPLTPKQMETWQILRSISDSLQSLFEELKLEKKVHETDVTDLIIAYRFPELRDYIKQIGGTRNDIYLSAGLEIKIMHYADWRMQINDIAPFAERLDFIFTKYWADIASEKKQKRLDQEFELEALLFSDLGIDPNHLDLEAINRMKSELFGKRYDNFTIGEISLVNS